MESAFGVGAGAGAVRVRVLLRSSHVDICTLVNGGGMASGVEGGDNVQQ